MDDQKLITSLERVEREVARLSRDVEKLLERTESVEPKDKVPFFDVDMPAVGGAKPIFHDGSIEGRIEAIRNSVKNSEYDLSAIRAILDDAEKQLIAGLLKRKR